MFSTSLQNIAAYNAQDFAEMRKEFEEADKRQQKLHPHLRAMKNLLGHAQHELHDGRPEVSGPLLDEVSAKVDQVLAIVGDDIVAREGWLSEIFDLVVRTRALQHFLATGKLISSTDPTLAGRIKDEEYLGGVMGLSQELSRYAIKRATEMDIKSIVQCRDLLTSLNGKLLEFEFRNGNLRRKYDAVKWGVRRMEDLLYELSIVGVLPEGVSLEDDSVMSSSPPAKIPRLDNGDALVPLEELEGIRTRMVESDERREAIIKGSRDVQKMSKNAIYSVHRNDLDKATDLLEKARKHALALEPHLQAHPTLRYGSYHNAMEEYAEAEQFRVWRMEGRLPTKGQIALINSVEYIGGLIDFTGEMGRYAVARATVRDTAAIKACIEMTLYIASEILRTSLPGPLNKKLEGFRSNQKKLEILNYESALTQKGKGRIAGSDAAKENIGGEESGEGGENVAL